MNAKNDLFEKFYDSAFRQKLVETPNLAGKLFGYDGDADMTYVVKVSTKDTTYIAMPFESSISLDDTARIQAAGTSSTGGTSGCISTAGCACSTSSTASSIGSAGSVASA